MVEAESGSSTQHRQYSSDGLVKELASNSLSRRGATLGLLAMPVFPSTAFAAGRLQPPYKKTSLGTFDGVEYFQ
jgi:hypothetical protein